MPEESIDLKKISEDWENACLSQNDKKLYTLVLKFFRRVLEEIKKLESEEIFLDFSRLIAKLNNTLPNIIDLNYEKSMQVKSMLGDFYNQALNNINLITDTSINQIDAMERPNATKLREESSLNKLKPKDLDRSEFFIKKIRDLFEENIQEWVNLYDFYEILDGDKRTEYRKNITDILVYLLDAFPDSGGDIVKIIISKFDLKKISDSEFHALIEKCMDKLPYPIIFALVNHIQELILDSSLSSNKSNYNITQIEVILEIFLKYSQYYPNYFAAHINLYFGLLGKFNNFPEISILSAKLLEYFAKQGDERINELFFDIYNKLELLQEKLLEPVIKILHEALSNGEDYVLSTYADEESQIDKNIKKKVYSNFSSNHKVIQEISFEIAIAIWDFEIIASLQNKEQFKKPKFKKTIFKPIIKILKKIIADEIDSVYLFMQAVNDCDIILEKIEENHIHNELQKRFLKEEAIKNSQELFRTIEDFIEYISQ